MASLEEQVRLAVKQREDELRRQHEEDLKRTIAEKDEQIAEKDEQIAEKDERVRELKLSNKQLKRSNKRLKRTVTEKDVAIAEKDVAIAEKDDAIAEKDVTIAEQNGEIKHYQLNNSIEGLRDIHNPKFKIKKNGGTLTMSHVDHQRDPATIQQAKFQLASPPMEPKTLKTASSLLAAFTQVDEQGFRVRDFASEADVQGLVHRALMDAVTILNHHQGDDNLLTIRCESGIFSNRPDHVVVGVGPLQTPIFITETKQPVLNIHNKVWGQIYDYNGLLRVVGHSNPFVVLSTFEQSWVTWQKSNGTCGRLAKNADGRFEPVRHLDKYLSHLPLSETPSPPSLCDEQMRPYPITRRTIQTRQTTQTTYTAEEEPRELCTAGPYEPNNLVNLFVNAISCSLANFRGSTSVRRDDQGYNLRYRPVMTMTEDGYRFQKISLRVRPGEFQYAHFDEETKREYHILDLLGSGRTSKVFLATTTEGHECVIKMYVRKFDEGLDFQPIKNFDKVAQESTAKEKEMYRLIYDMKIPVIKLFHHHCLVLPYCSPVPKDKRDAVLENVRLLLQDNFRVRQHVTTTFYKFKEDDQVWRHCGYRTKDQQKSLFLFDLGDLETCKTKGEHDRSIQRHINRLRERNPRA